ncbi:MAG: flippase, partial [Euryarchaeota archaeon]|nr:flippase [Euryarchaeota archaeon]
MKEILKGSLILTTSNLIVRFGSYFYRVLMGRMLTPAEFGLLNLALPVQFLAVVMASSGIAPAIAKFVSEAGAAGRRQRMDRVISSSMVCFTASGLLFALAFYLAAGAIATRVFHEPALVLPLKISAAAVPLAMMTAVYTGSLQGLKRMGSMGAVLSAQQGFRVLLAAALVLSAATAVSAIAGSTLGFLLAVPLAHALFRKAGLELRLSGISFAAFREVFVFSVPVTLTAVASFLLAYVDIILLGYYLSPVEVGIYSAASPTSRLVMVFSTALYATLVPSVAAWQTEGMGDATGRGIRYAYKVSLAVLVPATLLSVLFSEQIIGLLFGPAYLEAAGPFRILVVGTAFLGIFTLNSGIFQGLGRPEVPMAILSAAVVLDIVLNIVLIPGYQVT